MNDIVLRWLDWNLTNDWNFHHILTSPTFWSCYTNHLNLFNVDQSHLLEEFNRDIKRVNANLSPTSLIAYSLDKVLSYILLFARIFWLFSTPFFCTLTHNIEITIRAILWLFAFCKVLLYALINIKAYDNKWFRSLIIRTRNGLIW